MVPAMDAIWVALGALAAGIFIGVAATWAAFTAEKEVRGHGTGGEDQRDGQ